MNWTVIISNDPRACMTLSYNACFFFLYVDLRSLAIIKELSSAYVRNYFQNKERNWTSKTQLWKCRRFGLIEPAHGRYWKNASYSPRLPPLALAKADFNSTMK
jgi:hypothetical protein